MSEYDQFSTLVKNIQQTEKIRISCIVGAGLSAGSGLSTFRGDDGMYQDRDAMELASREGFVNNPELVWTWYRDRMKQVYDAEPNAGHTALVDLEKMGMLEMIITQNVDGLHRQAGQSGNKLVEIHGTLSRTHCLDNCGMSYELDSPPENVPVRCECGSYQRPSVVWFGEGIPYNIYNIVEQIQKYSNILLIIGTSGEVFPVARIPHVLADSMKIININPDPTGFDQITDITFEDNAEHVLPRLIEILQANSG